MAEALWDLIYLDWERIAAIAAELGASSIDTQDDAGREKTGGR